MIGPQLDAWRAPTDNDRGHHAKGAPPVEGLWRQVGLDRLQHRLIAVEPADAGLVVRTRVAPAGVDVGLFATYRWSARPDELALTLEVEPDGDWPCVLPRLGLRMAVPGALGAAEWFGRGPGEAYADSRQAARVGRFALPVDDMQTPYVYPQENGNRTEVRWAMLRGRDGAGIRFAGRPTFEFTARRWTSEALDAARHTVDLTPADSIWVNLDRGQQGIGSASCGPGVLPKYELRAAPSMLHVVFSALH